MQSFIRRKSYGCVKVFWLDRDAAKSRFIEAARRFGYKNSSVTRVVLFGSLADGRAVPSSDADILVVVEATDLHPLKRPEEFLHYFSDIGMGIDLFVYTEEEVSCGNISLINTALKTGIEIYRRK